MNKENNSIILSLHHIGVLVKDISQSAAEYTERFGYEIKSPIIHDELQTARVQFLKGIADSAYMELISPDGPQSKLTNALKKGGGLHHFCYNVMDIEESCQRLCNTGMLLLQKPMAAAAFPGRKIAWLMGLDGVPVELVEKGEEVWE